MSSWTTSVNAHDWSSLSLAKTVTEFNQTFVSVEKRKKKRFSLENHEQTYLRNIANPSCLILFGRCN